MTIKNDTILIVDDISNVDANVLKNNIKEFLVNYNNIRIILSTDIIEEFLAKIECVISAETELLEIKNKSSEKITFIFKNSILNQYFKHLWEILNNVKKLREFNFGGKI